MGSIDTIDEVGEKTMVQQVKEVEKEGEIILEEEEEDDDDIQCIGEKKATGRVMSMVDLIEDSDVEEIENESSESSLMDKAFTEEQSLPPMEQSIIDLSLDEDNEETTKKIASGSELPDFIPLIDDKKKNEKGKQPQFVQPVKNGVTPIQNGSSSSFPLTAPSSPLIMMSRTKSAKERKREAYRKKAETRAMSLSGSPCTIARSISSSTCSFPPFPQPFFSPSSIPLPGGPIPPSPLSHLLRFPSGSVPSMTSLASMGLIHTRGISTTAPQSQPVNFGDYNVPPPPLVRGMGGSCSTLASVLQEEAAGIVRDSLSSSGIYRRQWETECPNDSSEKIDPSSAPFRICSYNVLCQKTISATEYLYRHTKFQPHVLRWAHRWPLIQKELMELNADVFGLQEIQDVHFEEFYEPFMKSLGYICHYQPKSEAFHSDGLGIFVRANRFKITSSNVVDFLVPGDNLMNRGNVAQLLRVECLQTGASLIITNTHIIFNEKRGDVKLGQIALLMANIHAIRQGDEPVICLGDWNLEPKSDLYNYITNGSLDANQFVARYGSGQLREGRNFSFTPMRELPIDTHLKTKMSRDGILYQNEGTLLQSLQRSQPSILSHQIPLASTYAPYRERHVSTFHKDVANPDFIFYTTAGRGETDSRRLRLIRRLGVPLENGIKRNMEPWPNHYVPSDHIPLVAEFYLAK
ncbi:angl-1 [Pristionchus pacificus]|nr:angl-1 [Pristionchus pacificus]